MTAPSVSVVIPHYNRAQLLAETVRSVEVQSWKDWEIIVVDDGSTKEERTAIDRFASDRTRILERIGEPRRSSRCRNIGWKAARGQFVLFLDSDDLLAPWGLETRVREAEAHPDFDFWVFPVRTVHFLISRLLMALIALHVAGALYHTLILRDGLLKRVAFGRRVPAGMDSTLALNQSLSKRQS